jgi:hypothetical protein
VFGWGVLAGFELARGALAARTSGARALKTSLLNFALMTTCYVGGTLVLLGALDASWTEFPDPISHIRHIFDYGMTLKSQLPQGIESTPWQWMFNEVQIPYYQVHEETGGLKQAIIDFRGAMNPYLLFIAPLAIAACAWRAVTRRDELCILAVMLFFGTYGAYWVLWLKSSRICYIYYFLPTMPAVAIANAVFLRDLRPRSLAVWYVVFVALGTWAYFPFHRLPNEKQTSRVETIDVGFDRLERPRAQKTPEEPA